MIGRLTGMIVDCRPAHVVLDVGGVGYRLSVSLSTYCALAALADGARATLHVHTHVREDALQLYGFFLAEERTVFEELLTTSGVGPRLALTILSGVGAGELRECVARGDAGRLQKIPGVGKKTAERLLLELQHRWGDPRGRGKSGEGSAEAREGPSRPSVRDDAISALVNLGYAADAARRMIEGSLAGRSEPTDLGVLLREALARQAR